MKRRNFISSTLSAGLSGTMLTACSTERSGQNVASNNEPRLPGKIAGMTLEELREDYRHRLFDRYLPFWDKGGYDDKYGGFMCLLNEDGSVDDSEKALWYQGRAIWIYSMLYSNFGQNTRHLEIAQGSRDFMVKHMKAGKGTWYQRTYRDGKMKGGIYEDVIGEYFYGWMYAAKGLIALYRITKTQEDLDMAYESIQAALKAYDDPDYSGAWNYGGYREDLNFRGFRVQGHSMVIIGLLTELLSFIEDPKLEKLAAEHVNLVMNKFYNPELDIANENLHHDYSRIIGYEDYMFPGHSVETLWMIMFEAIRIKDRELFDEAARRIRRYIEIGWDYAFEGFGDLHYWVFDGPDRTRAKMYGTKSMWSHTELMIATLHILENTGENRAREWYERVRKYAIKAFDTDYGVWRQAVDRFGKDKERKVVYNPNRKGNYHFPRYLILNLLCIERMIKNKGKITPFSQLPTHPG